MRLSRVICAAKKKYEKEDDMKMVSGDDDSDYYMEKRVPMELFGTRDRKGYALLFMPVEKRACVDGFLGMRGKKQPSMSTFFGMRRQKFSYKLRGEFNGVRSKKLFNENIVPKPDMYDDDTTFVADYRNQLDLDMVLMLLSEKQQLEQLQQQQQQPQHLQYQPQHDGSGWGKRQRPSGFVGMRG